MKLTDEEKKNKGLISRAEAAAQLHCSMRSIDRYIINGTLDSVKFGKERLIYQESIDQIKNL